MTNIVLSAVNKIALAHSFQRKVSNWYVEHDDSVHLVNIQRSNFGKQFYINIAIWLRNEDDLTLINFKENKAPVRCRVETIIPIEKIYYLRKVLDLE